MTWAPRDQRARAGRRAFGRQGRACTASGLPRLVERVWLSAAPEAVVAVAHPQADCDLDAAVDDIVGLKFANAGQICVSPQLVMVCRGVENINLPGISWKGCAGEKNNIAEASDVPLLASLSCCMGCEAHGWSRQPYGRFDLSRRP